MALPLLVTASYDYAGDYVAHALEQRGERFFRLDTDRFPEHVRVKFNPAQGVTFDDGRELRSGEEFTSVWYRRHVSAELPAHLDDGTRDFCDRENRALIAGALACLPVNKWLSDPSAVWLAERKPLQLDVARAVDFQIPETLITNDPKAAAEFSNGRELVVKAVSSGYIAGPDGNRAIFTSRAKVEDLKDLAGLDLAPVIFQEFIPKAADIRVTIVGTELFAARIMSQDHESSRTDWRATTDPQLQHERWTLPSAIAEKCLLLTSRLGLGFGAIDLGLTLDDDYVFFEINPNGEWVWIEDQLAYPIADRIADWLIST